MRLTVDPCVFIILAWWRCFTGSLWIIQLVNSSDVVAVAAVEGLKVKKASNQNRYEPNLVSGGARLLVEVRWNRRPKSHKLKTYRCNAAPLPDPCSCASCYIYHESKDLSIDRRHVMYRVKSFVCDTEPSFCYRSDDQVSTHCCSFLL